MSNATLEELNKSIHSQHVGEVYDIPMKVINRPVQPVLDLAKLEEMKKIVQVRSQTFQR